MTTGYGDTDKEALLTAEERQQSVVITDPALPDNPMIYVSAEFEAQTGYAPDEVLGRNCRLLQGKGTDPEAVEAIRRALSSGEDISVDILNYRKSGEAFWNRLRIRPLRGDDGSVMFFAGVQNPIDADDARPGPGAMTD